MNPAKVMIAATAAALCLTLPLNAQTAPAAAPAAGATQPLIRALEELTPANAPKLKVRTEGWREGADIPFEYTQYRDNIFPGLRWSKGPRGTKAYAIIMQDVDSNRDGVRRHALHWTMYNIPATTTRLPKGMKPDARPEGSSYGPNYRGQAQPYLGPRTPAGPKHRYYMQVFALDSVITLPAEATYADLISQMRGHVLASGDVMGLGRIDPKAQ
jgi:para-nitrobenzyl esterase